MNQDFKNALWGTANALRGSVDPFELAEGDLLVARVLCLCWPILFKNKDLGCF